MSSKSVKEVRDELIRIFGECCWMNELWIPSKKEILTYHHIRELRNNGKTTLANGAILSESSHDYLNYLDNFYNREYKELNGLFLELNRTMTPPTDGYYEEVEHVLKRTRQKRY